MISFYTFTPLPCHQRKLIQNKSSRTIPSWQYLCTHTWAPGGIRVLAGYKIRGRNPTTREQQDRKQSKKLLQFPFKLTRTTIKHKGKGPVFFFVSIKFGTVAKKLINFVTNSMIFRKKITRINKCFLKNRQIFLYMV